MSVGKAERARLRKDRLRPSIGVTFALVTVLSATCDGTRAGSQDDATSLRLAAFADPPSDASKPEGQTSEQAAPVVEKQRDGWRFVIAPYLWASSIRSEVDAGVFSGSADACFSELIQNVNMAAQLRFEGLYDNRWGFYVDGTYMHLESGSSLRVGRFRLREIDVETEITQAYLDVGGIYRLGKPGRSFDLLLGGRYTYVATEVSAGSLLDADVSGDYVSPIVGGRVEWSLTDRWLVSLWGDVGGFGIGNAPDLVWGTTALIGYRLTDRATLAFGYRYYESGFDGDKGHLDLTTHGPLVGVAFGF